MNNFNLKGMVFMNDDKTAAIIVYIFTEEQKQLWLNHNELISRLTQIQKIIQIIRQSQDGAENGNTKIDRISN